MAKSLHSLAASTMPRRSVLWEKVWDEAADPSVAALATVAREFGIWLSAGSLALRSGDRLVNRSLLYAPDGRIVARYDKVHLFDVALPNGESYRESGSYDGGARAVTVDIGPIRLGLTICYDLRFPQLYLALAGLFQKFGEGGGATVHDRNFRAIDVNVEVVDTESRYGRQ